ncbi:MAG: hypothetical protein IMF17_05570, partial [Proteobacteria bacterium]|nr:hypothetical protein [Pseudomonadota bacterium]
SHLRGSDSIEEIKGEAGENTVLKGDNSSQTLDVRGTTLTDIDHIDAGAGHDTVYGSSGSDNIIGGDGTDTIVFSGTREKYFVTQNEDGSFAVQDLRDGSPDGTDTVNTVEKFRFSDGTVNAEDLVTGNPDNSIQNAVLIDGVVEGVEYNTSSGLHGFTDENGGYSFHEGDTITFNVGGVELGSVSAEEAMAGQTFLQDIADVERSDMNDEHLENMATFLQSIDSDSSDNIHITAEMREALSDVTIDLNTASEEQVKELVESVGGTYVDEEAAMEHVQDMLEEYTDMDTSDFDEHTVDQNETQNTPKVISATLVANAVNNISFETSSGLSGNTNDTGNFNYHEGDSITFYDADGDMISVINSDAIGDDGLISFEEISALADISENNTEQVEAVTESAQTVSTNDHTEVEFSNQALNTDQETKENTLEPDQSLVDETVSERDYSGTAEQDINEAYTQLDITAAFDVDTSSGWIDATEGTLDGETLTVDNAYTDSENPWTLSVDGEETDEQLAASALDLVPDTTGIVNSSEESEVFIDESERIEW